MKTPNNNKAAWQPIDTAPLDGTRILLTRRGSKTVTAGQWGQKTLRLSFTWRGWPSDYQPTHWMPLMELP